MSKSAIAIAFLSAALIASNGWWAVQALDAGISYTYQGVALENHKLAVDQLLAVVNATSNRAGSKTEVLKAAMSAAPAAEPFEKEGYVWVGRIGLKFDESDQLVSARRAWD